MPPTCGWEGGEEPSKSHPFSILGRGLRCRLYPIESLPCWRLPWRWMFWSLETGRLPSSSILGAPSLPAWSQRLPFMIIRNQWVSRPSSNEEEEKGGLSSSAEGLTSLSLSRSGRSWWTSLWWMIRPFWSNRRALLMRKVPPLRRTTLLRRG